MFILALLVLWPIAELAAAIAVAHAIGVLLTVILLVAGWPVGTWLLRAEGRAALRHFREAAAGGRPPAAEVVDGALALLGGSLLIVPGFITDVLGLALLVPALRRRLGGVVARNVRSRLVTRVAGLGARSGRPRYDADSTARDVDRPQLHG